MIGVSIPFLILLSNYHKRSLKENTKENIYSLSKIIIRQLENFMVSKNPHFLEDYLINLVANSNIENISICSKTGKVTFSSDILKINNIYSINDPYCFSCHSKRIVPSTLLIEKDEKRFLFLSLVPNNKNCYSCHNSFKSYLGVVAMEIPSSILTKSFNKSFLPLVFLTIFLIGSAIFFLNFTLNSKIIKPIFQLSKSIEDLKKNPYEEKGENLKEGIFINLSREIKMAFQDAYKKNLLIRLILESINQKIRVIDKEKKVIFENEAMKEELEKIEEFYTFENVKGAHQKIIKKGDKEYLINLIPIDLGKETLICEVYNDISLLKKVEEAEKFKLLGFLSASLSHQLNTPLSTIINSLEIIKSKNLIEENKIMKIENALAKIENLSKKLIFIASLKEEEKKMISIKGTIWFVLNFLETQIKEKNIICEVNFPEKDYYILSNPVQVEQIFYNLYINAIEAIEKNGVIRTTMKEEKTNLIVEIEDNGKPIDEKIVKNIFEPFISTKNLPEAGLGLFLVKIFMENLKGSVSFSSEGNLKKFVLSFKIYE